MRPGLDDPALVDDEDRVRAADRRQAVGDDERRPVLHDVGQGGLDQSLGFRIERRGGFIQDQDGRIFEKSPGDRQALPLPDREQPPFSPIDVA